MSGARRVRPIFVWLASVALLAITLIGASPASANYAAAYHAECCSQTLESRETGSSWFEFVNTGSSPWGQDGGLVRLGTSTPAGGAVDPNPADSPFYVPGDWISPKRPTALDQDLVRTGQIGRFTFPIHAPTVSTPTTFRQYFEPLREGVGWMGAVVWLDYTVLPSQPPKVKLLVAPRSLRRGDPIAVAVAASDNSVVDHVTVSVGGVSGTAHPARGLYYALLDSTTLAPGAYPLVAKAVDRVGNVGQSAAVLNVAPAPDADGDGFADFADKCPRRKAGRSDRDHDGCPGPYRRMHPRVHGKWMIPASGVVLTRLTVKRLPRRAVVRVDCNACHVHERRRLRRGHTLRLTGLIGRTIRAGSAFAIRVSAPGYIGSYFRYVARPHGASTAERVRVVFRPFVRTLRCLPAGRTTPAKSCPIRP